MKNLLLSLSFLFSFAYGQTIISHFTWDSNPVTQAVVGPNATSTSSSSTSDINGVGGTNGLNPGSPKMDINMDIPGSPTFDIPGIDIFIDFQREESRGDFVRRGNNLVFGMNGGNLSVTFRLDDGAGSYVNVNSGNVYSIPNDDVFRTYRFFYLPTTGVAELRVDGVTVWSYAGAPGRGLYWTGAGDLRIGNAMDAAGSDETVFDNLIIASVTNSALPITLKTFDVSYDKSREWVDVNWITASEINNDHFEILRSKDGYNFTSIGKIKGAENASQELKYNFIDRNPLPGVSYYRLKQVDLDGATTLFDITSIEIEAKEKISVYPNPVHRGQDLKVKNFEQKLSRVSILDQMGRVIQSNNFDRQSNAIRVSTGEWAEGVYILLIESNNGQKETRKIVVN